MIKPLVGIIAILLMSSALVVAGSQEALRSSSATLCYMRRNWFHSSLVGVYSKLLLSNRALF